MEFLKQLLGLGESGPSEDPTAYVGAMKEMADEAERVHRNTVQLFSDEFTEMQPTGEGLYKARVRAAVMPVWAYAHTSGDENGTMELLNVATGVALEPLVELDDGPESFSKAQAQELGLDYVKRSLSATVECMREGPSVPGAEKPGFQNLADLIHESLRSSVGVEKYTDTVRERFDTSVKSGLSAELKHAAGLAGESREYDTP